MKSIKIRRKFRDYLGESVLRLLVKTIIAIALIALIVLIGAIPGKAALSLANVYLMQCDDVLPQDTLYQMRRDMIESSDAIISWTASLSNDAAQVTVGLLSISLVFLAVIGVVLVAEKITEEYQWEVHHLRMIKRYNKKGR